MSAIRLTPTQAVASADIVRKFAKAGQSVQIEDGYQVVSIYGGAKQFDVGRRGKVTPR